MIIAAHADGNTSYLARLVRLMAANAQHQFIIFCNAQMAPAMPAAENCRVIITTPAIRNSLTLHYWYQYKLPSLLRRQNVQVFVSESGTCSQRTTVPQLMFLADAVWKKNGHSAQPYGSYLRKYFAKAAAKAAAIVTSNPAILQPLKNNFKLPDEQIFFTGQVSFYEPHAALPQHGAAVQQNITNGNAYLVAECDATTAENMVTLLKAFSLFKKRMKTGMQLVIINRMQTFPVPAFGSYKYRDEVHIKSFPLPAEESQVIAGAYAAVYLPAHLPAQNFALQCMQEHLPVMMIESAEAAASFGEAVIQCASTADAISGMMMLLYRDETYRQVYQQRSEIFAKSLNWQAAADNLLTLLQNAGA